MEIQNTKDLQKEVDRLKESIATKTELISISSHQLRTSLSAVKWVLKMLEDGDYGKVTPEQKTMIQKARESNDRMVALVNDVLNLNHLDSLETAYEYEPIQLADMVQEVLSEFAAEAKKKNITLSFPHPDPMPPTVNIDPEKIRVVLQNLIENALKYSPEKTTVNIAISVHDEMLLVSVADGGIGIPDDATNHIFEKFYRARNAQEKETVGSGLGLYTSKHIMSHHNGSIWFEKNQSGNGTTFYFSLPIA